jgi:uncharacterized protein (TIGR02391 family)
VARWRCAVAELREQHGDDPAVRPEGARFDPTTPWTSRRSTHWVGAASSPHNSQDDLKRSRLDLRSPIAGSQTESAVVSVTYIDNLTILKAIDAHQQEQQGRPLWMSAHQLLGELSGTHSVDVQLMPGFLQELFIARDASQLTWRLTNQNATPGDANYYLQQIYELALTPSGQDRARNRVVVMAPPDPDEDDGRDLSDLILRRTAAAIDHEYAPDQAATFLGEQGIPPHWLPVEDVETKRDTHATLAQLWRAGSMGRRLVRQFLGRWLNGDLITGPDAELRAALIEQLARQGWQIRPSDSVLVVAEPVRGIPVSAPFLREARLHPLIEAEARPQFLIRKLDQAVFASLKAVEIRVRTLGGYASEVIGTDLMNRAFGPTGPLTNATVPRGEQDGVRALFAGAFGALRNPAGHRQVEYSDISEAAEAVQLASLLMRVLDRVEDRLVTAGRTTLVSGPAPTP